MFLAVREEKGERRERLQLLSTFSWSEFVGSRTKVHLLDEGYEWVLKTRDFAEDSSKEFRKLKVSSLRSVHGTS